MPRVHWVRVEVRVEGILLGLDSASKVQGLGAKDLKLEAPAFNA